MSQSVVSGWGSLNLNGLENMSVSNSAMDFGSSQESPASQQCTKKQRFNEDDRLSTSVDLMLRYASAATDEVPVSAAAATDEVPVAAVPVAAAAATDDHGLSSPIEAPAADHPIFWAMLLVYVGTTFQGCLESWSQVNKVKIIEAYLLDNKIAAWILYGLTNTHSETDKVMVVKTSGESMAAWKMDAHTIDTDTEMAVYDLFECCVFGELNRWLALWHANPREKKYRETVPIGEARALNEMQNKIRKVLMELNPGMSPKIHEDREGVKTMLTTEGNAISNYFFDQDCALEWFFAQLNGE